MFRWAIPRALPSPGVTSARHFCGGAPNVLTAPIARKAISMTSTTTPTCRENNCDRAPTRRGLCTNHYRTYRHRMLAYQRWESTYIDGQETKAHLRELVAAGMAFRHIVARTGLSKDALQRLHAQPDHVTCRVARSTADKLLAISAREVFTAYRYANESSVVDGTGSRRRLRALVAVGWPQRELAQRCDWVYEGLNYFINQEAKGLTAGAARRVEVVFRELQLQPCGPSLKARRLAQRRGWLPPLAWDEDSIDDPYASPHCLDEPADDGEVDEITVERCLAAWRSNTEPPQVSPQDRVSVASALLAAGATRNYTSQVVGWSVPTMAKRLAEVSAA